MMNIEASWEKQLAKELQKPYATALFKELRAAYQKKSIYPPSDKLWSAFTLTPFINVSVVILGQDPYHGPGQAQGLAFSVPPNQPLPPSLKNIYREITSDIGVTNNKSGDLSTWATQGVLLLNSVLTVEAGKPGSHQSLGWEQLTDHIISTLSEKKEHLVFMLWGQAAQTKADLINQQKHLILMTSHPSPLSAYRGFFGSRHFSTCNQYLESHRKKPIKW
jgi:uracil-DNA glycosylase